MKAKRKGPRYVVQDDYSGVWIERDETHVLSWDEMARLLNAGERAKAEVKRLRAEVARLQEELQMDRMCE